MEMAFVQLVTADLTPYSTPVVPSADHYGLSWQIAA